MPGLAWEVRQSVGGIRDSVGFSDILSLGALAWEAGILPLNYAREGLLKLIACECHEH